MNFQKRLAADPDRVRQLQREATARFLEAHPEQRHRKRTYTEKSREAARQTLAAHPETRTDRLEIQRRWREAHPEELRAYNKKYRVVLRLAVLDAYGGCCACCGESTSEFLTIDHIANDGFAHRKRVGGGYSMYLWLKRNQFPEGVQVLCHNCNMAKGFYGSCPHSRLRV